jgi:hypothetical protein
MINLNLQDRQDGSRDGLFLLLTFLERSGTERSTMTGSSYEQALKTLEKTFKNRIRRPSGETEARSGALASVLPLHAQEVELLAREVARYSMPLAAVGGGTSPEPVGEEGKLLVRFDLMRGVRLPNRGGG